MKKLKFSNRSLEWYIYYRTACVAESKVWVMSCNNDLVYIFDLEDKSFRRKRGPFKNIWLERFLSCNEGDEFSFYNKKYKVIPKAVLEGLLKNVFWDEK